MKRILTILCLLIVSLATFAVPARRGTHTVTQPNGDTIHIQLIGDEHWHAHYTADGYLIKKDEKGWWCYAVWNENENENETTRKVAVCTRKHVKDEEHRSRCQKRWLQRHHIPNRNQ